MGPHAQDADDAFLFEDLVDKPVLNVDPAGIHTCEAPDEALVAGRRRKRILSQNLDEALSFRRESAGGELLRILRGLLGENDPPHRYHSTSSRASSRSSRAASFRLSVIPGIPCRYKVS